MIYILQSGLIAAQVYAALEKLKVEVCWAGSDVKGTAHDWLVCAFDHSRVDQLQQWAQVARDNGMSFFPVHAQGGEVVIGPDVRPGRAGCLHCWEKRYFRGRPWLRRFVELAAESEEQSVDPWLTPAAVSVAGRIAADRLLARLLQRAPEQETAYVYYFQTKDFSGREWPLKRDHRCHECGQVQTDHAARARIKLSSCPKPDSHSDRLRSLKDLRFVKQAFGGHRSNIVESSGAQSWPTCAGGVVVSFGISLITEAHPQPCSGFSSRHSEAETAAILEGVERYSGVEPRGFSPTVHGSFRELSEFAVDPSSFGLHSDREYKANPELKRYSEDLQMSFVWAHSFRQQRQVLVPLQIGFYSRPRAGDNLFVLGEGSSGCSMGSRLEEAILHGIFEIAERDAYMLTWLAERSPARIELTESRDPEVRHVMARLRVEGFTLQAFDITTDLGIPAVGLLARREKTWPHLMAGAAAHLRPEKALKKALRELAGGISLWELSSPLARERAREMCADPARVRKPMDHGLMYTDPGSSHRCEFLTASSETTSLEQMGRPVEGLWSADLGRDLERLIDRIIGNGFDVITVKHTGPEEKEHGLEVAKVLIPGTLPGTWGDHLWRVENLPRLDASLAVTGRTRPNAVPHPFP